MHIEIIVAANSLWFAQTPVLVRLFAGCTVLIPVHEAPAGCLQAHNSLLVTLLGMLELLCSPPSLPLHGHPQPVPQGALKALLAQLGASGICLRTHCRRPPVSLRQQRHLTKVLAGAKRGDPHLARPCPCPCMTPT
jgi:hypothetical protein